MTGINSKNYRDVGELQKHAEDLEARIGRQAILIERVQAELETAHANYTKLINVAAQIKSGAISLDRFVVLPNGASWQVAALVNDSPVVMQEPDETCPLRALAEIEQSEPAVLPMHAETFPALN